VASAAGVPSVPAAHASASSDRVQTILQGRFMAGSFGLNDTRTKRVRWKRLRTRKSTDTTGLNARCYFPRAARAQRFGGCLTDGAHALNVPVGSGY
jgi:hypothetical protein